MDGLIGLRTDRSEGGSFVVHIPIPRGAGRLDEVYLDVKYHPDRRVFAIEIGEEMQRLAPEMISATVQLAFRAIAEELGGDRRRPHRAGDNVTPPPYS